MSRYRDWSVASLLARVATLEAAVKPFAAFAAGFEARTPGHCVASHALGLITVADLRRARAALEIDDDAAG